MALFLLSCLPLQIHVPKFYVRLIKLSRKNLIKIIFKPFRAARVSQLTQGFRLYLPDTLARYIKNFAYFFKRARSSVLKPEPKL